MVDVQREEMLNHGSSWCVRTHGEDRRGHHVADGSRVFRQDFSPGMNEQVGFRDDSDRVPGVIDDDGGSNSARRQDPCGLGRGGRASTETGSRVKVRPPLISHEQWIRNQR